MIKNKNKIKLRKIFSIIISLVMVSYSVTPSVILAQESEPTPTETQSSPPEAPEAPTAPTAPSNDEELPEAPEPTNTPPTEPTSPTAPTAPTNDKEAPEAPTAPTSKDNTSTTATTSDNTSDTESGQNSSNQTGDTSVKTGDANNDSSISTTGNNNLATSSANSSESGSDSGSASIVNSGNGALSDNSGSATINNHNDTDQNNSANVTNNLDSTSKTGDNNTSFNVGDSSISTGDANTTGTVITTVNTNIDGIGYVEFNVIEDHNGDIYLDYSQPCQSNCGPDNISVKNLGNGAESTNSAELDVNNTDNTNQTNNANIESNLNLFANSGSNDASFNTGGDSNIKTGDANVSGNVLTFANNNIDGNVVYTVVNIFGDLVGDIILTEAAMNSMCGNCLGLVSAENSDNGAGSENNTTVNSDQTNNTSQFNAADIDNNLMLSANTGNNDTNFNTGGSSTTQTGDADIQANVVNVANNNIAGGNMWLVLINDAGRWVGKLLGEPSGSTMAASEGMDIYVDDTGEIVATNSGNGAESTTDVVVDSSGTTNTTQNNNASITNNVNLGADTGNNSTSYNTGGDSNIQTGDANVVANIVNFVNNNIVGTGKLFVTVVNVFGSWVGDFVTPGQEKENKAVADNNEHAVGGTSEENENSNSHEEKNENVIAVNSNGEGENEVKVQNKGNENRTASFSTSSDPNIGGNTEIESTDSSTDETKVAGITVDNVQEQGNKVVRVNLAWLLIILPALLITIRKREFIFNLLPSIKK